MEIITAKANENVKRVAKLNASSSYRAENNAFVLEGIRLCYDAFLTKAEIEQLYYTEKAMSVYGDKLSQLVGYANKSFVVSEQVSSFLSDTKSPQGVYCVVKMAGNGASGEKLDPNGVYIVLENVQDPSNVGAISRTAEALGASGLFVAGGCDIYNPKVQRAAMGSLLRLPVYKASDIAEVVALLKGNGISVLASTPRTDAVCINELKKKNGVAVIIGNEGAGVTQKAFDLSDITVTIPMKGRAESLNASMAAGIIMWELLS